MVAPAHIQGCRAGRAGFAFAAQRCAVPRILLAVSHGQPPKRSSPGLPSCTPVMVMGGPAGPLLKLLPLLVLLPRSSMAQR